MHTDNIMLFIFIGLTTLIPILPAYIFYKILPGKTSQVDGTFHTLKFKLSGAFAGYFLIVFILIMVFKDSLKKTDEWQIWEGEADTVPSSRVVVTGAALGLPGTERVFDDSNVARILAHYSLNGGGHWRDQGLY